MKSLDRLRNWVTTVIGILLMGCAVAMYVIGKFENHTFDMVEIVLVSILGWLFLWAKDSILEGIFLGLIKKKKNE